MKRVDVVQRFFRIKWMSALTNHDWPGNIRELQNFIERAVIMTTGTVLRPRLADLIPQPSATTVRILADAERAQIVETLRETNRVAGGKSGAAARLACRGRPLIARMQRLGLMPECERALMQCW